MALHLITAFIVLAALAIFHSRKPSSKLPPGPPKIPFFGNRFQVSPLRTYPQFRLWARKYGPIFHLRFGPQNIIVLNTAEAANELFVNRSRIYSSRASPHVAQDLMSAGQRMLFLSYGKEWKVARKLLQSTIGPGPSKNARPTQELESRVLLYDLMSHGNKSLSDDFVSGPHDEVPEGHWFSLIRRFTTSVVMNISYGKRVANHQIIGNPHLHKIYDVLESFSRVAQPGNYLVDAFPILRKLPDFLAPWRAEGKKLHEWEMELWGSLLEDLKQEIKQGTASNCLVGDYLKKRAEAGYENAPGYGLTEDGLWMKDIFLTYTAASVLEAGSDTTATVMVSFILFMLSHPHVLRRAREEIDNVVGPDRFPDFEDESRLPYLIACIKETFRRRPVVVMGVPHRVEEDDVYNGYIIPKNSTVIGNVWAIHTDPERYPNPFAFDPERFMTQEKPVRWASGPETQGRDHYVFGWGRRFCQGSVIAEASLFIVLARILWGIDFEAPKNPVTGAPIIPDVSDEEGTFTDGFVPTPKIFRVSFKPRSEKHGSIIRKSFEEAQAEWQMLGLVPDEERYEN